MQHSETDEFIIHYDKYLGKGQYGTVYRSTRKLNNGLTEQCCVKIIQNQIGLDKLLEREIDIMKRLNVLQNPNLVNCFHITSDSTEIKIFMEICEDGDLSSVMKQKNGQFSTEEAKDIVKQVINGYKSLLSINIIHRDMKPANILRTKDGTYKIADFGLGRFIEDIQQKQKLTKLGTPRWAAPQIILQNEETYSAKVDIFSLGTILYQLLFNQFPGGEMKSLPQLIAFLNKIKQEPIKCPTNNNIPEFMRSLNERMLQFKEENRIGWKELIEIFSKENQTDNQDQQQQTIIDNNKISTRPSIRIIQRQPINQIQQAPDIVSQRIEDSMLIIQQNGNQIYINNHLVNEGRPSRIQRIKKIIEILLAKGDQGLAVYFQFQKLKQAQPDILTNFEQALIMTSLLGYKTLTLENSIGFAYNNINQIDKSLQGLFRQDQLLDAIQGFYQDQGQGVSDLKNEIENQYFQLTDQFLVNKYQHYSQMWQNTIMQFCNQGIPQQLIEFFKLLNLQQPTCYNKYHQWFKHFYQTIIKHKLSYQQNQYYSKDYLKFIYLCQKLISNEEEYPFFEYLKINTENMMNVPNNEIQIRNYLEKYQKQ